MNNQNELHYIYNDDGELMGMYKNPVIYEQEVIESRKEYFKRQEEKEHCRHLSRSQSKELGDFVWNRYRVSEEFLNVSKPSSLTRLVFLSTYLNYNGVLKYDNGTQLTTKHIFQLLNLSKKEFYNFLNEMKSFDIIYGDDENGWKINPNIFYKGELPKQKVKEDLDMGWYYMRLYTNGIRAIYNQANSRSHKTLSYIFQIIPYINRRYNIVCWNPLETELHKIERMTLGEYCELIGYDKSNSKRLMNIMFQPKFSIDDGTETSIVRFVCNKYKGYDSYEIFINPRIYYAGNNWKEVEVLGGF